jgi:MOSC domain-containing protein YiiM
MKLISVNTGQPQLIDSKSGKTGIFKVPVEQPVQVHSLGLDGDVICDTENHGGVDQAVYIFTVSDYSWWSHQLKKKLAPGTFGENLLIDGFDSADCLVGDQFHIGDVILEVTSPRIPCATLAARMNDKLFVKIFMAAERPGVYCRVLQHGTIEAGMDVVRYGYEGERVPVIEHFRSFFGDEPDAQTARRYLSAPIHYKMREQLKACFDL